MYIETEDNQGSLCPECREKELIRKGEELINENIH
jgi:hypothetical protein